MNRLTLSGELSEQDQETGELDEAFEYRRPVVIADAKTAEDLQPLDQLLDLEPPLVAPQGAAVLPWSAATVAAVRRHQLDTAHLQPLAQRVPYARILQEANLAVQFDDVVLEFEDDKNPLPSREFLWKLMISR